MKALGTAIALTVVAAAGFGAFANAHSHASEGEAGQSANRDDPMSYRDDPLDMTDWELEWSDEFGYPDAQLDENWISSQGDFESDWVRGRRWRRNAVVADGILELRNIKDDNDPHVWSSASIWTRRTFGYGYYEARYKYAGAYGTNNSFWFWPKDGTPEGQKACEIDVNEGHYPNVINTNIHNWTDVWTTPSGREDHASKQIHHTLEGRAAHSIVLDAPISTTRIRIRSNTPASIHIREFRVLAPADTYPEPSAALTSNFVNHAADEGVNLRTVGISDRLPSQERYAIDGRPETRWVSKKHGPKWLELEWAQARSVGAIQILNGDDIGNDTVRSMMTDFTLEAWIDGEWQPIGKYDAAEIADYSQEYHTYGFEWSEDWFKWYIDGVLFHVERNRVCFSEVNMLLSMAILNSDIAGPVTDDIDGTAMMVDYVRYYRRRD